MSTGKKGETRLNWIKNTIALLRNISLGQGAGKDCYVTKAISRWKYFLSPAFTCTWKEFFFQFWAIFQNFSDCHKSINLEVTSWMIFWYEHIILVYSSQKSLLSWKSMNLENEVMVKCSWSEIYTSGWTSWPIMVELF